MELSTQCCGLRRLGSAVWYLCLQNSIVQQSSPQAIDSALSPLRLLLVARMAVGLPLHDAVLLYTFPCLSTSSMKRTLMVG